MDEKSDNLKKSKTKLYLRIFLLVIIVVGIVVALLLLKKHFNLTQEKLQELIAKTGAWGPLVFILISFLQVTFMPVPSTMTILVGNYLFGIWWSFLYSYIGIILGSLFAFFLGRVIGKPFVVWVIGDKKTVEDYLLKMRGKENVILFFMFLFPFFPDDALCTLAGILPIKLPTFIIMQIITRAIGIGGNLLFLSGEIIPFSGWGIPVIIILGILAVVAFVICYKKSDQINELFYKFIEKITRKVKK